MSKFIQALFAFITALWRKGKPFLESYAQVGVEVVERIKLMIDSPEADRITKLIPGIADDKALAWLRKVLPGIIEKQGVPFILNDANNVVEWVNALLEHLQKLTPEQRRGFLRDLAANIALEYARLEDYKHLDQLTTARINLLIELAYLKITDKDLEGEA